MKSLKFWQVYFILQRTGVLCINQNTFSSWIKVKMLMKLWQTFHNIKSYHILHSLKNNLKFFLFYLIFLFSLLILTGIAEILQSTYLCWWQQRVYTGNFLSTLNIDDRILNYLTTWLFRNLKGIGLTQGEKKS